MYNYVKSLVKENRFSSRWKEVNLNNMSLKDIFLKYDLVYLILNNIFLGKEIAFDLANLKSLYINSTKTIAEFLVANGNNTLTALSTIPTLNPSYVRYNDVFRAGYKVKPVGNKISVSSSISHNKKEHLLLTKDKISYSDFYQHCLVNVNGYFHITDFSTEGIYVNDANKTLIHSNRNEMGILNFKDVGKLQIKRITNSMIKRQLNSIPLSNKVYIKLPQAIGNRIPILVLGGYMNVMDPNLFHIVNEDTICLNFMNYNFIDRYFESKEVIDLSSLPIEKYDRNPNQLDLDNFYSDSVIKAYLTLSQSFIVLVETNNFFIDKVSVENTKMPGILMTQQKPIYPLIGGNGQLLNYWYQYEDRKYSLTVTEDRKDNLVCHTTDVNQLISISNDRETQRRKIESRPYFLLMGKDL